MSINRYHFKELQSLIPNCWANVKQFDIQFDKCSQLFETPNEVSFNSSSHKSDEIHDTTLPTNIDFMDQQQLAQLDNLVTLFLDLSLPYNMKKDVQTLVWYLIFSYQASIRYSTNLLLYILPRHLSSFYLDLIPHLSFSKDSTFRAYKTSINPSREYITSVTIKHFNNYQQLSLLARRLCIEMDRDEQNSELMAFYNSIQIELFNQPGGIRDNQLRYFVVNAMEALKFPKKRNYYNTYLCGISALFFKINLSIEIQNDIIHSLVKPAFDGAGNAANCSNLKEIILLISTSLKHQNKIGKLPIKWINLIATNHEYQRELFVCLGELIEAEIEPFRFCELITTTILDETQYDDSMIGQYVQVLLNLISHLNQCNSNSTNQLASSIVLTILNKLENICTIVNENLCIQIDGRLDFFALYKYQLSLLYKLLKNISNTFPRLYSILIRSPINANEHFMNFLKMATTEPNEVDPALELDSSIQYISNIAIFEHDIALNIVKLSLERFQHWSQSNTENDKLSLLASKLVSLLPNYRSQILNNTNLWQFVSRMQCKGDFLPIIYQLIRDIMCEVDNSIIECLCDGLVRVDKDQLFTNDYTFLEYCLNNLESSKDLFTCIDIITQIGGDYPGLSHVLGPISFFLTKLAQNNNLNGRLKTYITSSCLTLNSINCCYNWAEMSTQYIADVISPPDSDASRPILSIHILMEYLDYLCADSCVNNAGKIITVMTALIQSLDKAMELAKISSTKHVDKIPLISTLANSFHSFSIQLLALTKPHASRNSLTEFQDWVIYNILVIGCTNDILYRALCKSIQTSHNTTVYSLNLINCRLKLGLVSQTVYKGSNDSVNLSICNCYQGLEGESFASDLAEFLGEKSCDTSDLEGLEGKNIIQCINCPGFRLRRSDVSSVKLYKRLLKFLNMTKKDSSTAMLILLIYLAPLIIKHEYIEPTIGFIRSVIENKCNFDIVSTMKSFVSDGFLVSDPLKCNFNIPKSDINNFVSDFLSDKSDTSIFANFLVMLKTLLSKYQKVAQSVIFLSHFLPINILRHSKPLYTMIGLNKFTYTSTFQLFCDIGNSSNRIDARGMGIMLNVLRIITFVTNEKVRDKKFSNNYVRSIILPLSSVNSTNDGVNEFWREMAKKLLIYSLHLALKLNMLQYLDDQLLGEIILLLGENVYLSGIFQQESLAINMSKTFKYLLNLIKDDGRRSYQVANVLVIMSDHLPSAKLLPDIIAKIELHTGDLKVALFLSACKIAGKYLDHTPSVGIQLIKMGIDGWWGDSHKYCTETSITFINLCRGFAKVCPEVSSLILDEMKKLSNPVFEGLNALISHLIKTALVGLTGVDTYKNASGSRRLETTKTAAIVWNNYSTGILLSTGSEFAPIDYYIYSAEILRSGRIDRKFYESLVDLDKVKVILSMSSMLNSGITTELQPKLEILAELVSMESESGVLQITTAVQSEKDTHEYKKIRLIGDILHNLLTLLTKCEYPSIKRSVKLLFSKTHLLLNTPHLILAILDYPYYYSPNEQITVTSSQEDIPVLMELFKLLTNIFNRDIVNGVISDSLKGLEVSILYYKIACILSKLYKFNPHVILKSFIFLVRVKCSDSKVLRTIVYPLVSTENETTQNLPKQDIYLLCKLVNLSTSIPNVEAVLGELGLGMIKALIIFNKSFTASEKNVLVDVMICTTIATLSAFVKITSDVSDDLFYLSLGTEQVAIRTKILISLAKSLSFPHLTKLICDSYVKFSCDTVDNCICGFNLMEFYVQHFQGEITVQNRKITQMIIKLITKCSQFETIANYPNIDSITLADYINKVEENDDTFSRFHFHMGKLLTSWFGKTTLFEMTSFLQTFRSICNAKSPQAVRYHHLYLYLVGNILCQFKHVPKVDTMLLPTVLPIVNVSFASISLDVLQNCDIQKNLYFTNVTLSLTILAAMKEYIISVQLMSDLVESLALSICAIEAVYTGCNAWDDDRTISNGKRKREKEEKLDKYPGKYICLWQKIIETILVAVLSDDNYEIACKGLVKQLSLGSTFFKKTLLSSLFNIWSKIDTRDDCYDAYLVDRLGSSGRELTVIVKDLEFDGDYQVASLAKRLGKRLESFCYRCNQIEIDE